MRLLTRSFLLALLLVLVLVGPASAAGSGSGTGGGSGGYWEAFKEYWAGTFQKQNGVVIGVLAVGVVGILIITRGKWQK